MPDRHSLAVLLLLTVLAFGLRLSRLDWSFSGDETTTIEEEGVLFRGLPADPSSQLYKLPRVNPLGYLVHHVGYLLFGFDERGTRTSSAIFGALQVVITFLLLEGLLGRPTAFATAALILTWPDHLVASQDNRFYIVAAFFVWLALLLGGHAVKRRSWRWLLAASVAACLGILSHAVQGLVLGTLASGVLAAAWAEKRRPDTRMLLVLGGTGVAVLLYFVLRLLPLVRGWNEGSSWGYSTSHAILAAASSVGVPLALLVPAGALLLFRRRTTQSWYWLACSLSWVFMVVVLPSFVVYHPPYAFPLEATAYVLVGALFGEIYDRLREQGALIATSFIGLVVLINVPGVASHLMDGSRYDYRSVAAQLVQMRREGDRVAARSPDLLKHYAPAIGAVEPIYVDQPRAAYDALLDGAPRTWVVVHQGRSGLPGGIENFLDERCGLKAGVEVQRYDYYQFRTALYLCTKTSSAAGAR